MDDERLRARVKRVDEVSTAPRPAFVDALHDDLAARLGLTDEAATGPYVARPIARVSRRGRTMLLIAAALMLLGAAAAVSGVGSFIDRLRAQPTLLETIRTTHTLRVAVRADHPQSQPALSALDGFDLAVAEAVAKRLDARLDVVVVPAGDLPLPESAGTLLGMPSRAIPAADAAQLIETRPYYRWPVYLIVPGTGGGVTATDDLAGSRVCVVPGTAGEAWLAGRSAAAGIESITTPPADVAVVTRLDDRGCLDALDQGQADAAVTARLLPGDLTTAAGAIVGDGPVAREPAGIVVADGKGVGELEDIIDTIIRDMGRDGTLRSLSLQWFGGEDLTAP
jgi:ABC-type amino acid transport substrate-binding protein